VCVWVGGCEYTCVFCVLLCEPFLCACACERVWMAHCMYSRTCAKNAMLTAWCLLQHKPPPETRTQTQFEEDEERVLMQVCVQARASVCACACTCVRVFARHVHYFLSWSACNLHPQGVQNKGLAVQMDLMGATHACLPVRAPPARFHSPACLCCSIHSPSHSIALWLPGPCLLPPNHRTLQPLHVPCVACCACPRAPAACRRRWPPCLSHVHALPVSVRPSSCRWFRCLSCPSHAYLPAHAVLLSSCVNAEIDGSFGPLR